MNSANAVFGMQRPKVRRCRGTFQIVLKAGVWTSATGVVALLARQRMKQRACADMFVESLSKG